MYYVRAFATKQPVDFPDRKRVFEGYVATHLRDEQRLYTMLGGEVAHVFFARRNGSRHE
jgi:hypothetical protein